MNTYRKAIRDAHHISEGDALKALMADHAPTGAMRQRAGQRAIRLIEQIREDKTPTMMELFLGEYGLSSDEGVALMCLAEALLRVPDADTIDALIEDKIAPSAWGEHLGKSHSSLINASTWALFITGKVLNDDTGGNVAGILHGAIKRLGEPVIRQAVARVMKEMGRHFVLGETIEGAIRRAKEQEKRGYSYSYDMLGEAARSDRDAMRYHAAYAEAITHLGHARKSETVAENPGISIKLSALHPRYEALQHRRVMTELLPRAQALCLQAKSLGIGVNIDAEEAGRLELSLDVIEALISDPSLAGWAGFGVVVQAYSRRAPYVLDWLAALARRHGRKIMVRLVKGAYWDSEIKHAQVEGLSTFPVFTRKAATDVSYICCAQKLLAMRDVIYPQFATHNAHTVAAVLEMAGDSAGYEFQRLHGMGESLYDILRSGTGQACRIYAPVGAHKDLLAYLVRRLLENGANSSFVNQIVDASVPASEVAADPFAAVEAHRDQPENPAILPPADLFLPSRVNSRGWDLEDPDTLAQLQRTIVMPVPDQTAGSHRVVSPATGRLVGSLDFLTADQAATLADSVRPWAETPVIERARILNRAADLYEAHAGVLFGLLMSEAGKTIKDCVNELREAVDFLRYYAAEAMGKDPEPRGVFACISPWNFPLAIFTGQITAALAAGNAVLAKPAEATPLIARYAVGLLHEAGVPADVLILLPGTGAEVGNVLTSHPRVDGVCFTGSTATAQRIHQNMAAALAPTAPLIAETGGLNAMIIDSTALPEQAVDDIITSAFQSAGQRCSALRMLYIQEDIAEGLINMLFGAMDELSLGDPADLSTDIGPVIDANARADILCHIDQARAKGNIMKEMQVPDTGTFVGPTVISVAGIEELEREVFGPVLHIATYRAEAFEDIIAEINNSGYGLTFGFHSRIDDRVQTVVDQVRAGNIYVNRNQIGAVVGVQPFGGEGLSGTGPKAGGPRYVSRFSRSGFAALPADTGKSVTADAINAAFATGIADGDISLPTQSMPGPTGESNTTGLVARRHVLCLGPGAKLAGEQAARARALGCHALAVAPGVKEGIDGVLSAGELSQIEELGAVISCADDAGAMRMALARRDGPIVALLQEDDFAEWLVVERHVCIDTTASGGNAALLAAGS